jgi:deoxycytidylate deaminase
MTNMCKYLKLAEKCALENDFDPALNFRLAAVLVKGGQIIATGYNKRSTNSFVEHYADKLRGKRQYCLSTHAELDAICKARIKMDISGSKIYVCRIRKADDQVAMARPCPICETALSNYGVKRAFYTITGNDYGVMKPQNQIINAYENYDYDKVFSNNVAVGF